MAEQAAWLVEIFAGYDLEDGGAGVWKTVATGHNRARGAILTFLCLMARPDRSHRLRWIPASRGLFPVK